MRSLGFSRLGTLRRVELPAALPSFFSGLKIAATVSVIGAVFGEWAEAQEGLGRRVLLDNNNLETPRVYAGIVLLTLMAVALFALAALAERVACPWNREEGPLLIRRLLPLALLAAADRRLRREGGPPVPLRREALRRDARLLPQRRPRRHLRRPGPGALQAGRARREHPPAQRPGHRAQAGVGREGRPRDLLRAPAAGRPRPGAAPGGRGRAGPGAADLDHLPAQGEDQPPGRPEGQDGRHRRDRLPDRLPAHDRPGGERQPQDDQGAQRRLRTAARAAVPQGRRHPGRASGTTRASTSRSRSAARGSSA